MNFSIMLVLETEIYYLCIEKPQHGKRCNIPLRVLPICLPLNLEEAPGGKGKFFTLYVQKSVLIKIAVFNSCTALREGNNRNRRN